MNRTSKLERILFRIVRICMLVAALLALLAAIGLGINGLVKSSASVDNTIKAPSIRFDSYTDQLAKEKAAQDNAEKAAKEEDAAKGSFSAPQAPAQPMEPEQFPSQYRDTLNELEKRISSYAQKTGQPVPTEMLRRNLYLEAESRFDSFGLVDDFFAKLVKLCESLDSKGEELRALDDSDPRKIFWGKFLDYVYDRYQNDLNEQTVAIARAEYEAGQTRLLAPTLYMAAGVCAGAFFILTLLLVLLNIEKNTYVTSTVLRAVHPDAYKEPELLIKKLSSTPPRPGNGEAGL